MTLGQAVNLGMMTMRMAGYLWSHYLHGYLWSHCLHKFPAILIVMISKHTSWFWRHRSPKPHEIGSRFAGAATASGWPPGACMWSSAPAGLISSRVCTQADSWRMHVEQRTSEPQQLQSVYPGTLISKPLRCHAFTSPSLC